MPIPQVVLLGTPSYLANKQRTIHGDNVLDAELELEGTILDTTV